MACAWSCNSSIRGAHASQAVKCQKKAWKSIHWISGYKIEVKKDVITINVPVVFMAWYVMVLRSATSLRGALEGVGPENWDFFGPWNGMSEASAIWAQKSRDDVALLKTIKCKHHKSNWYIGSFMYPSAVVHFCCVLLSVVVCCCVLEGWGGLLVAVLCEQVFRGWGLVGRAPPPPPTIV